MGFQELEHFAVDNLGLVPSPQLDDLLSIQIQGVSVVDLTGIRDSLSLSEILAALDSQELVVSVSLTRCAIDRMPVLACSLGLKEIDDDQDLIPPLRNYDGDALRFINCPSLGDDVLDAMSAACLYLDGTACAPNVEQLYIRSCPNFTIRSLKRLVSARLEPPANAILTTESIGTLEIVGDVPRLSREDFSWFCERVPNFYHHRIVP
jgi:hypothetical protein